MRKIQIGVIGDAGVERGSGIYRMSEDLGKTLIDNGFRIISGGMSGTMEAVCKGAKGSENYKDGMVIGITPGFDPELSNQFVDIVIPTGLDTYRNGIVANSDAVVAIGGRAGTLSEMAFAWTFKRMVIAYDVPGWSGKLAGSKIDDRNRIAWKGDKVFKVKNAQEVVAYLNKYLHHYKDRHISIISKMKENKYKM